jgi:biotin-dependent carboxylase-like uncharacterized protein
MSITIERAPPYLTVQDFGRTACREVGVPRCGAMDRLSLAAANAVLGNDLGDAALEWALGGGSIRFDERCSFAIGGASVEASLSGQPVESYAVVSAAAGDVLEIRAFRSGRFLYVAFEGGLNTETVLGSRSTYLPAHFGGIDGRIIRAGDVLPLGSERRARPGFSAPIELRPEHSRRQLRVIAGPQWQLFSEADKTLFFGQAYSVSRASDRMGYRLEGNSLSASLGLLASEAVCEGAIQVPPGGLPIVLMSDSPTIGGYPKIGVVASTDIPILAQLTPGETFRFEETSVQDAQRRLRRSVASLYTIQSLATRA